MVPLNRKASLYFNLRTLRIFAFFLYLHRYRFRSHWDRSSAPFALWCSVQNPPCHVPNTFTFPLTKSGKCVWRRVDLGGFNLLRLICIRNDRRQPPCRDKSMRSTNKDTKQTDCTSEFGMGYLLHNGTAGVIRRVWEWWREVEGGEEIDKWKKENSAGHFDPEWIECNTRWDQHCLLL